MIDFIRPQRNLLFLSNVTLAAGLVMLIAGIAFAYVLDLHLSIGELVGAHTLTILGPSALKIGYVMRLLASYQSKNKSEERLQSCCLLKPIEGLRSVPIYCQLSAD